MLLTQWEVARKRAGVGGGTMLTAQSAPWFTFALHERVPSHRFAPRPSVDGGLLAVSRRAEPLVPHREQRDYQAFVRAVFTSRGGTLRAVLQQATGASRARCTRALQQHGVGGAALPRDLTPLQWSGLWLTLRSG
nr:rRNA adenine N-6-methyltransferase family protein [Microbacterium sp. Marseille-Q6965]